MGSPLTSDVYPNSSIKLPSLSKNSTPTKWSLGNKTINSNMYANSSKLASMPSYNPNLKLDPRQGMSFMGKLKSTNWQDVGSKAMGLAPIAYNLAQGIFNKPEKISSQRYFNPYTNQIRGAMANRRYNIDPILAANSSANAIYNRNAMNVTGGNRSLATANLMAGLNARYGADATAYAQQNNINNQYLSEQANMDYYLGQSNAQALATADEINAANRASRRNYLSAGMSGLQQYGLVNQQMRNQLGSQNAYLQTLNRANPYYNQWLGLDYLQNYNR